MALADSYASVDEYREAIQRDDNADDIVIERDLDAVSRYVDRITGYAATGFNQTDSESRYLWPPRYGTNTRTLFIPPMASAPTSVKLDTDGDGDFSDETTLDLTQRTGDVILMPDDWDKRPLQVPITALELTPWGAYSSWPYYQVEVIGVFGWPAVPEQVRAATIQLTAILRLESPRATEQVTELDASVGVSREAQNIVRNLLRQLRNEDTLL